MTVDEARRALDAGAATAARLVEGGAACLVTGDMGIANTTPSAALIASLTDRPAAAVTGRGTGIDDDAAHPQDRAGGGGRRPGPATTATTPSASWPRSAAWNTPPWPAWWSGRRPQVPVVVDGVIAASALLVASRLVPGVEACVVAGHRSVEPGSSAVLDVLGLEPVIDLGLRLGEGTGRRARPAGGGGGGAGPAGDGHLRRGRGQRQGLTCPPTAAMSGSDRGATDHAAPAPTLGPS